MYVGPLKGFITICKVYRFGVLGRLGFKAMYACSRKPTWKPTQPP